MGPGVAGGYDDGFQEDTFWRVGVVTCRLSVADCMASEEAGEPSLRCEADNLERAGGIDGADKKRLAAIFRHNCPGGEGAAARFVLR
eukprot:5219-Rhodomonas_salina.2